MMQRPMHKGAHKDGPIHYIQIGACMVLYLYMHILKQKVARNPADHAAGAAADAGEDDASVEVRVQEGPARLVQPHPVPLQGVPARKWTTHHNI